METKRLPGYEDAYAYIDSQFLDQPDAQSKSPAESKAASERRGRAPVGPLNPPPAGVVFSPLAGPPPPVPAESHPAQAELAGATAEPTTPVETSDQPTALEVPLAEVVMQTVREASPAVRRRRVKNGEAVQLRIPNIEDYLPGLATETRRSQGSTHAAVQMEVPSEPRVPKRSPKPTRQLKRPELSGPRPRKRATSAPITDLPTLPDDLRSLVALGNDEILRKYYQRRRAETKEEMLSRITNPELTLEETAKLLGVCPATVRRYTNKGWLRHHRTKGNQRRFRLSDIAEFVREFRDKLE